MNPNSSVIPAIRSRLCERIKANIPPESAYMIMVKSRALLAIRSTLR